MSKLYFLHGMESSPQGTKSKFLKEHFPDCIIPHLPPDNQKRMEILGSLIGEPAWIVGSSLGGLSAVLFAMKNPGFVKGMVIMAPAVGFFDKTIFSEAERLRLGKTYIPAGIPCVVIAAEYDDVIPLQAIEDMLARSPDRTQISLIKVKDDHRLNQSLDILYNNLKKMMPASAKDSFC